MENPRHYWLIADYLQSNGKKRLFRQQYENSRRIPRTDMNLSYFRGAVLVVADFLNDFTCREQI